jgi:hypothetical protein
MIKNDRLIQCYEKGSLLKNNDDVEGFEKYLQNGRNQQTAKQWLSLAKQYAYVLEVGNANDLLTLADAKRLHIMKALAILAKFYGIREEWRRIKDNYGLKWTSENNDLRTFQAITSSNNYQTMIESLKQVCVKLPKSHASILLYMTLTGLRPVEAITSMKLIKTEFDNYYNPELSLIEHFRYPKLFIRRTKKAFLSVVDKRIVELAKAGKSIDYSGMWDYLHIHNLNFQMKNCRKIHGTYLRKNGIDIEMIDLLQGRLPKGVFLRFYNRPSFSEECDKVRTQIIKLHSDIT